MNKPIIIVFLWVFLNSPCFVAGQNTPAIDSLKNVLSDKVSEMEELNDYVTSIVRLNVVKGELDELNADMVRLYMQHGAEIEDNPELAELFGDFTRLKDCLENNMKTLLQQNEKDSIAELLQKHLHVYDSIFDIGQRLSADNQGDSVMAIKQQERDYWIVVKTLENGNKGLLQTYPELQEIMDTLNARHEQISTLSEKKSTPIGEMLPKIIPIIIALIPFVMMAKAKIQIAKQKKNAIEKQKKAQEEAKKTQEEASEKESC